MEIRNKDYSKYVEILQKPKDPYQNQKHKWKFRISKGCLRTRIIKSYFKSHTNLDLGQIEMSEETTWENAIRLAVFVAANIPHDNQKRGIRRKNAISLWKYAQKETTGFNCRWHAILLSELMTAVGIKNCFVTCLPEDGMDSDCHVVNHIWLPETKKWAMIDSDMKEYVVNEKEQPLSLREIREYIRNDQKFFIRSLPTVENTFTETEEGLEYMKCYWAKNTYWFARHTTYGYNLESTHCVGDSYICLVPLGYHYNTKKFTGIETTDVDAFWD